MQVDLRNITPGTLPEAVFVELIAGTKIESERLTAALREHLVAGTPKTQSANLHEVNPSQFSRRLKTILADAERIGRIVAILLNAKPTTGIGSVIKLADELLATAQGLQSSAQAPRASRATPKAA